MGPEAELVVKEHADRVRAADQLVAGQDRLAEPGAEEELFEVRHAVGVASISRPDPGSMSASWGPLVTYTLKARVGGPDPRGALGALLDQWEERVAGDPASTDAEHGFAVVWPSRDTAAVAALMRRGFTPAVAVTARVAQSNPSGPMADPASAAPASMPGAPASVSGAPASVPPAPVPVPGATAAAFPAPVPVSGASGASGASAVAVSGSAVVPVAGFEGARLRRAGLDDLDVMTRLFEGLVAYDAQFGWINVRPSTAAGGRAHLAEQLAVEGAWCWVAEVDGVVAGMVTVEQPSHAGWVADLVNAAPAAYLGLMYTDPAVRGRGLGLALAAQAHACLDAAGIPVTLLHHAVPNPLSTPFWARQGYRPLLTQWARRRG